MFKTMKALENGVYTAKLVALSTSAEVMGVKRTFDLLTESALYEELVGGRPVFYSAKFQLSDRTITVNKFANKTIWTDNDGNEWTSVDFFLLGIQRQFGLEDETDDIVLFKACMDTDTKLWISQYVNPKTGVKSYNVDSTQPKNWEVENSLGLEF